MCLRESKVMDMTFSPTGDDVIAQLATTNRKASQISPNDKCL